MKTLTFEKKFLQPPAVSTSQYVVEKDEHPIILEALSGGTIQGEEKTMFLWMEVFYDHHKWSWSKKVIPLKSINHEDKQNTTFFPLWTPLPIENK